MRQILTLTHWESRILDCFSMSKICKSTQTQHLARIKSQIWDECARKHGKRRVYPASTIGFISGFIRACDIRMMREEIEFCYIVDGIMYSTHKQSTHKTTSHYCNVVNPENGGLTLCRDDTPRGLFWAGTDKRYF